MGRKEGVIFKGRFCPVGGGVYVEASTRFFHGGLPNLSRCLKAEFHDAGVVVPDTRGAMKDEK